MPEVYRKRGHTLRYESGTLIRIHESGEAIEEGSYFYCHPLECGGRSRRYDSSFVTDTRAHIKSAIPHPLSIERLIVATGESAHEFGDHRWSDTYERVHVSLTHKRRRVLIDALDEVAAVANAFARISGEDRSPSGLTLAPAVTAALLPNLIGIAPPNIELLQTAGGVDGKGGAIEARDAADPINWYRPSYRVRPVRAAFNIRALCSVREIDASLPRAIALLEPPQGLTLRVLCVDGNDVFPTTFRVTRIDSIAEATTWYPYGAGSFGAEMTVF